jgi:hypothetical protein
MNTRRGRGTGKESASNVSGTDTRSNSNGKFHKTAAADAKLVHERVDCGYADASDDRERRGESRGSNHLTEPRATANQCCGQGHFDRGVRENEAG